MSKPKCFAVLLCAALSAPLFLFCGKGGGSNPASSGKYGTIEVRARVANGGLAKSSGTLATVADSLVVEVSGGGAEPVRKALKLDLTRPSVTANFTGIPAGNNRSVVITAVARGGALTHIDTVAARTATIEVGKSSVVNATLIPAAGSIYLQFSNLSSGSSVHAVFAAADGSFAVEATVNRGTNSRAFVNLDTIPHGTVGILTVIIYSAANGSGDIDRIATQALTFSARGDNNIQLNFQTVGGDDDDDDNPMNGSLGLDVTIIQPGVTVASYYYNGDNAAIEETGELIITEIMWNAGNDNYIELYNPADTDVFFGVLTTNIDGTKSNFDSITVASRGYIVIGRQDAPHVDIYTPTTGGLPVTSTGNWITVSRGDGAVIDRVICPGSNTVTGWPVVSGRRSVELLRDKYNATDNNYGKNWRVTEGELIEGTTIYGTPGR